MQRAQFFFPARTPKETNVILRVCVCACMRAAAHADAALLLSRCCGGEAALRSEQTHQHGRGRGGEHEWVPENQPACWPACMFCPLMCNQPQNSPLNLKSKQVKQKKSSTSIKEIAGLRKRCMWGNCLNTPDLRLFRSDFQMPYLESFSSRLHPSVLDLR